MNNKGFSLVELMASIIILGLILTIVIPSVNGVGKFVKKSQRNNLIKSIEINGARYAFDTGETYFFVDDLIKAGYMDGNENNDNNLMDPVSNVRLNCYAVLATKVEEHYSAKFIDDVNYDNNGVCDNTKLKENNTDLNITANMGLRDNVWVKLTSGTITLSVSGVSCGSSNVRCQWSSSRGATETGKNTISFNIDNTNVIDSRYNFQITYYNSDGSTKVSKTSFGVKIDNEAPEFNKTDSRYNSNNTYTIIGTDGIGSGIKGYYIGTSNCNYATNYYTDNTLPVSGHGTYYICIKDNVDNIYQSGPISI